MFGKQNNHDNNSAPLETSDFFYLEKGNTHVIQKAECKQNDHSSRVFIPFDLSTSSAHFVLINQLLLCAVT